MDNPFFSPRPNGGHYLGEKIRVIFLEGIAQTGAVDGRKRLDGNKILWVSVVPEALVVKPAAGRDKMNMGVIFALSRPGVKDCRYAGKPPAPRGVPAQVKQGGRRGAHQQIKQFTRMRADDAAHRFRDGEGNKVIGDARQQQGTLLLQPLGGRRTAARGTMSVAASQVGEMTVPAAGTAPKR